MCEEEVTSASIGYSTCTHCNWAAPTMVTKLIWIYPGQDGEPDDSDYQLNQYDSGGSSIGYGYHNPSYNCPYTVTPQIGGSYTEERSVTGGFMINPGFETEAEFSLPFGIAKNKVGYTLEFEIAVEGTSQDGVTLFGNWTGAPISVNPGVKVSFIIAKYKDTYNVYCDTGKKGPNYYWICPKSSCGLNSFKMPLVTTINNQSLTCTGCKYSFIEADGPYYSDPYWEY